MLVAQRHYPPKMGRLRSRNKYNEFMVVTGSTLNFDGMGRQKWSKGWPVEFGDVMGCVFLVWHPIITLVRMF